MQSDVPATIEPDGPSLPGFIRNKGVTDDGSRLDFWVPERKGDPILDYMQGIANFEAGLAFARACGAPQLFAFVVMAMRSVDYIELGFIDAMASKATYGRIAPDASERELSAYMAACDVSERDARQGEEEARLSLVVGRSCRDPDCVRSDLLGVINQTMGQLSTTFLWTVSRAAYNGGFH